MRMGGKKQPERMVRNRAEETSESRKRANHDAIQLAGPDNNSNNNSNSNNSKSSSSTLRPSSSSSATSASPSSSSNYRAPRRGRCNYAAHTVTSVGFAGFGSPPISCAKMIFVKKKQKRKRNKNAKTEKKKSSGPARAQCLSRRGGRRQNRCDSSSISMSCCRVDRVDFEPQIGGFFGPKKKKGNDKNQRRPGPK